MNWQQASQLISQNILIGTHLIPTSRYRHVTKGPNHACFTYDYQGSNGYKVQIGKLNFIEIPFRMLETLFNASVEKNGVYNNEIFQNNYPRQYRNHDCHVHVVGKIFEIAGVAWAKNARDYKIL